MGRTGACALLAACLYTGALRAETTPPRRVAIVVGANEASPGRKPLRYAHLDAQSVAQALDDLGGFADEDIYTLFDPTPADLLGVLDDQLRLLSRHAGDSLLLFYYSGHSDMQALYPAGEALPLQELRARLDRASASVRVGIIDACRGGGWTGTKGLSAADTFAVDASLGLQNEGSVLISSSAGLENAHESEALRGSFFTHHWVAGLRGAADRDADGSVTLSEAFDYAKALTIRDTAKHTDEPQHPSFHVNLRGRQDLALTSLAAGQSTLNLTQQHGPLQIVHLNTGLILSEVPEGPRSVRMALRPGRYVVRKKENGEIFAKEVALGPREALTVGEGDLKFSGSEILAAKGPTSLLRAEQYEEPTTRSRAEVVLFQTLYGIVGGAELCVALDCQGVRPYVGAATAGGALGAGASLLLTDSAMQPGQALLLNVAPVWGAWHGVAVGMAENLDTQEFAATALAAEALGLGVGAGLWMLQEPTLGDVAFANLGGYSLGILTLLAHGSFDFNSGDRSVMYSTLAATDLGIVGGALLSRYAPISSGRVLMITVGGHLGALLGAGTGLFITRSAVRGQPVYASTLIGAVLGLGTSAYFSEDWDAQEPPATLSLLPTDGGGMAALHLRF